VGARTLTLYTGGGYNGTAAGRDLETGSWWSGNDGVCFQGEHLGHVLTRIPTYQGLFRDFLRLHPDGSVMTWFDRRHRDGRHGHGSAEYPGKPGLERGFFASLQSGEVDPRYPESELMLTVADEFGTRAFPLEELRRGGHAANVEVGGVPVVALCQPGTHVMGAYRRGLDERTLSLRRDGASELFVDDASGSTWDVEGRCVGGDLAGRQLEPVSFVTLEWHATVSYHPDMVDYHAPAELPDPAPADDATLAALLARIEAAGYHVEGARPLLAAWLPPNVPAGVELRVDGHPLRLLHFDGARDAEDWAPTQRRALSGRCLAVASWPTRQFEDQQQKIPIVDEEMEWAPALDDERFTALLAEVAATCEEPHVEAPTIAALAEVLAAAGLRLSRPAPLLEGQLPVGAELGYSLHVERDRWQLLRFADHEAAAAEATRRGHALAAGRFMLWSDPPQMYRERGTTTLPDDEVPWSDLLDEPRLLAALREALAR
jgi:hypothetical protein